MLDVTTNGRDTWVLTPEELETVFSNAEPGSTIVYAVGDLAYTRETALGGHWANAENTAKDAYKMYERGEADLTQKKLAPNRFEYRATKR